MGLMDTYFSLVMLLVIHKDSFSRAVDRQPNKIKACPTLVFFITQTYGISNIKVAWGF